MVLAALPSTGISTFPDRLINNAVGCAARLRPSGGGGNDLNQIPPAELKGNNVAKIFKHVQALRFSGFFIWMRPYGMLQETI